MKHFLFFASLFFLVGTSSAQFQPVIEWQTPLGGSSTYDMIATSDGGYLLVGEAYSWDINVTDNHGDADMWVVKTDAQGIMQWNKSYGGSDFDAAKSVIELADGSFTIIGSTYSSDFDVTSNNGSCDVWLINIDSSGILNWQENFGGSKIDLGEYVIQTQDGGYFVFGSSGSDDFDVSMLHIDTTSTSSFLYRDIWVLRLNSSRSIVWEKTFGGDFDEFLTDVIHLGSGDFLLSGLSRSDDGDLTSNAGYFDAWVLSIDSLGAINWQNTIGGSNLDFISSLHLSNSGEIYCSGITSSMTSPLMCTSGYWIKNWFGKLDATGNLLWNNCYDYGAPGSYGNYWYDRVHFTEQRIIERANGNFLFLSSNYSKYFGSGQDSGYAVIRELDANGVLVQSESYGGTRPTICSEILVTPSGKIVFSASTAANDGDVVGAQGNANFWLVQLDSMISTFVSSRETPSFTIYPNPTDGLVYFESLEEDLFKIELLDATGRLIQTFEPANTARPIIDLNSMSPGSYLLHCHMQSGRLSKSIVIE